MKKLLAMVCIVFGCTYTANANGETKTTGKKTTKAENKVAIVAEQRANYLSDVMIRDLGLNNYQSRKLREINKEVVAKKVAVEAEFAGNQAVIAQKCKEICNVRDAKLENVLSTRQYNEYFGDRKVYEQTEQDFVANLDQQNDNNRTSSVTESDAVSLN